MDNLTHSLVGAVLGQAGLKRTTGLAVPALIIGANLPDGCRKPCSRPVELSVDEIRCAVTAFAQLGLWKVRLTGGEPSLRRDFEDVARAVAGVPGIRRVAVTTNGYRLAQRAQVWRDAGINAINVSVDSLDPARFAAITRHDRLAEVLDGIEAAGAAGFDSVKLNAVLTREVNDDEMAAMVDFVRARDPSLSFIEVMRTNDNAAFFRDRHIAGQSVIDRLEAAGWHRLPRAPCAGSAVELGHPDAKGRIGSSRPMQEISAPVATGCGCHRTGGCICACSAMAAAICAHCFPPMIRSR
ncbi:MAG: radical SAM protein [Erythrobacter sp.]|nr:radical SAM protein [Erythrobacter sp.]